MLRIAAALLGLSLLIVIHEAGHYLVSRAFGIRMTRFSIGFGPVLLKFQSKGSPMFLGYEMATGRRPSVRVEGAIHAMGLLVLLGCMMLMTVRDVAG